MKLSKKIKKLSFVFLLTTFSISANAALIKSYDFNGDLSDTLGNGVDLIASGGSVSGSRYNFLANQGLKLNSALQNTSNYGIEMKLQMTDNLSGYNKLIDFQNLTSDYGLYIQSGAVNFYTSGPTAGSVSLGADFTIGFAVGAGSMSVFLDNALLFNVASSQAIPALNILNFFEDDFATGQNESFAGSVDFIRIHDDSSTFGAAPITGNVPEPGTLFLLASGLFGISLRRRSL